MYLCRVSTLKGIITYAVLLYLTVGCTRVTVWVILQNMGQVAFPLPPKSSEGVCKTKYKMSPSSVRSEGGEAAAGYCLNSVSYRVDEAVKYNVLNSD